MSTRRQHWIAGVMLVLAAVLPGACAPSPDRGYTFRATHDPSVATVAVPIFANDTLHTGLETVLTEAVIKRLQQQTPWRVTDQRSADVVLRGSISRVRLLRLSQRTGVGLVQEQGVEMSVSFDLLDNRRGGTILSRRGFAAIASFVPANPTGERIDVGYRTVAETMAADIVDELGTSW
ncbi:MAG: LPS assembly lipoprotein LptE [Planctomycetota bacterium]